MKTNKVKWGTLLLSVLLLTGCSSSPVTYESGYADSNAGIDVEDAITSSETDGGEADTIENSAELTEKKIAYSYSLTIDTDSYEKSVDQIHDDVEAVGGYIAYESNSSYSDDKIDHLEVCIPADKADDWVDNAEKYGKVREKTIQQEDITSAYIDTESRLTALATQQKTLLGLMEKAENIDDILSIQNQLTNVNSQIESYKAQKQYMDQQTRYSLVTIDINSVGYQSGSADQSFWEEALDRLNRTIYGLGNFVRGAALIIIGYLPIEIIIVLIAWVVRRRKKTGLKRITMGKDKNE